MSKFDYLYKTEFVKMGKWNLLPLDSNGNWHSEETSRYFKKVFGFGKGTFVIQTLDDDMQHAYFPQFYIDKLYSYIERTNVKDYKKLDQTLKKFYSLKKVIKKQIGKTAKIDLKSLTNKGLIKLYLFNRGFAHQAAVYDQFGWIVEDYWNPIMEKILVESGLKKGSDEYLRVLFILTKPENISTTLLEKREVLLQAIKVKQKKSLLAQASKKLAKEFGWLPVFTFGTPWEEDHYQGELAGLLKRPLNELKVEYEKLQKYRETRNSEISEAVAKYKIHKEDLQKFIDFGLALDARNEAEYLVSLCGYYLLPIYDEIARRLYVSVKQLRNLLKQDVIDCLSSKADPHDIFARQGKIIGWVWDKTMVQLKVLGPRDAKKFFNYLNKHSKGMQGNDETKGICASPGKVVGRARILHYPNEGEKVKSGDILITHATTVDYLPPMKRAAAFVTEVGGLTCHAAVVAREFGVPCVVGLKNATKNFKNGDMVEVDANKGIVRKI